MSETSAAGYASTIDEAARHFDVHRRTLTEWLQAGAPGKTKDGYDLQGIAEWHARNRPPKPAKDESDIGLERRRLKAEVEKKEAEAAIKQHDAIQKTEAVVHLDDVELFLSLLFTRGRRRLMRIAEEVPPGYPKEVRDILREDLEERLKIWLKSMASECLNLTELRK